MNIEKCPFCGDGVLGFVVHEGERWGSVMCECGACGPDVWMKHDLSEDAAWHEKAIDLWNRRC